MENSLFTLRAAVLAGFVLVVAGPAASLYSAIADLSGAAKDAALVVDARRL